MYLDRDLERCHFFLLGHRHSDDAITVRGMGLGGVYLGGHKVGSRVDKACVCARTCLALDGKDAVLDANHQVI